MNNIYQNMSMYMCIYIYMYTYAHVCARAHTHTHTHTHTPLLDKASTAFVLGTKFEFEGTKISVLNINSILMQYLLKIKINAKNLL